MLRIATTTIACAILLLLSCSIVTSLRIDPPASTIEELVAREQLKITGKFQPTPRSVYDPSDCLIKSKYDVDAAAQVGNNLIRKRHLVASHDCFKNALNSWFAGVQSKGYVDKTGEASERDRAAHLNTALKQLQFQGIPGFTPPRNDNTGGNNIDGEDRPQIPPQLLFEHNLRKQKQKQQQASVVAKQKQEDDPTYVSAPRMVRDKEIKRKLPIATTKPLKSVATESKKEKPVNDKEESLASLDSLRSLSPQDLLHKLALQTIGKGTLNIKEGSRSNLGPYRL